MRELKMNEELQNELLINQVLLDIDKLIIDNEFNQVQYQVTEEYMPVINNIIARLQQWKLVVSNHNGLLSIVK
jgi:hypothetical protein